MVQSTKVVTSIQNLNDVKIYNSLFFRYLTTFIAIRTKQYIPRRKQIKPNIIFLFFKD